MSFLAWPAANSMPGTARTRLTPLALQLIETVADDRRGKFEIAVFDRVVRQTLSQMTGEHGEFRDRIGIAAAMAAQHHTEFFRHVPAFPRAAPPYDRRGRQLRHWPPIGSAAPEFAFSPSRGTLRGTLVGREGQRVKEFSDMGRCKCATPALKNIQISMAELTPSHDRQELPGDQIASIGGAVLFDRSEELPFHFIHDLRRETFGGQCHRATQ